MNYKLDEDSPDAAEEDESLGYFSDEELQDDEKEEVTDDDFFNLLSQHILEDGTARKRPPKEQRLTNWEQRKRPPEEERLTNRVQTIDFADTVGLVLM